MSSSLTPAAVHAFSELALGGPPLASVDATDDGEAFQLRLQELGGLARATTFLVYPFHDIELVKRVLLKKLGLEQRHRIGDVEVFYNDVEVPNRRSLNSFVAEDVVEMTWRLRDRIQKGATVRGIRERGGFKVHPRLQQVLEDINTALQRRVNPKLTMEGTGATYIMCNVRCRPIGVFKPQDEEAFAPNNPRGYVGRLGQQGFRAGVYSGEGATREVAAFLLDAFYGGFSGVPVTAQVDLIHPHLCYDPNDPSRTRRKGEDEDLVEGLLRRKKKDVPQPPGSYMFWKPGSLQEFVNAKDSSADYDPRMFCIGDVHRVGILDIRLANMDRNDGNLLVVKTDDHLTTFNEALIYPPFMNDRDQYKQQALLTIDGKLARHRLIPIDHGLTLPDCLDITDFDLCWLNWPQAHIPFMEAELEYIEDLKPDKDAEWLETKLGLRSSCLRLMQVTTRLLKRGAKHGLTLHQMAMLMVRTSPDSPSPLEKVIRLSVSQACFASFATSLVHRRETGMKYAMDLAAVPNNSTNKPPRSSQKHWKVNGEDEHLSSPPPPTRPRSKTVGRLNLNVAKAGTQFRGSTFKGLHKINYTAIRHRDQTATDSLNSLWVVLDAGGRLVTPDWDNKRFLRMFLESLETMLDFLITEKFHLASG